MVCLNRTRADYLQKFEELIEAYNSGSRNIDEIFKDLLTLTQTLTEEEDRQVRENLSEEELAVFDILTRPGTEPGRARRSEEGGAPAIDAPERGAGAGLAQAQLSAGTGEAGHRRHAG